MSAAVLIMRNIWDMENARETKWETRLLKVPTVLNYKNFNYKIYEICENKKYKIIVI